jgi:predicted ribosomally synthesized peptide with nif11-like leader
MSLQSLEQFRELVLREPALQEQLSEPGRTDDFLALVLRVGRAQGFDFTESDLITVMQAHRQAWMERWVR